MRLKKTFNSQKTFFYLLIIVFNYIIQLLLISDAYSQSEVYLSVRAGGSGLITIGLGGFESSDQSSIINSVKTTLEDDLFTSGLFQVRTLPDSAADSSGSLFELWKDAGAKYYLLGEEENKNNTVTINLIDLKTALTVLKEEYRIDSKRPWHTAHVIVDDMIEFFTGLRGSMVSQIAFVRTVKGSEEIFLIDADGRNLHQLTFSKTLLMSPDWSPDGNSIAYSAINRNNWLIMMININTGQSIDISQWSGLNTTPAWSPITPGVIAFTSSRDGNAEIYTCRIDGKDIRRLTNHGRIDSSPSWSPDGSKIAFTSDRTGNPLIYIMNSDGSDPHRLTSTPNAYEDSPCWSPRGDRIAFVMMSDYGFDIVTTSPTGEDVVVLTFAQGSNEDPQWSPDGLRILFTSTRTTGTKRLFIMNRDGSNVRPLTIDGNNFSPAWGPSVSANDIRISSKR